MKTMNAARQWTVATILIVVVLLAAFWFLLISPVLAEASETNDAAQAQEDANAQSQIEVDKLRKQFANIETYRAQLSELQEGITTRQQYSDLQRLFAEVASEHDVTITSLRFESALPLEVKAPVEEGAEEETNVETTEPVPSATPSPNPDGSDPAAAAPKGVTGLYSIAVGMTINGKYNDVLAAVNDLQVGPNRIVLITSVALAAGDSSSSGDEPAADAVTADISGETFVLVGSDSLNKDGEVELPEEEIPLPQSTDNPLTPPTR